MDKNLRSNLGSYAGNFVIKGIKVFDKEENVYTLDEFKYDGDNIYCVLKDGKGNFTEELFFTISNDSLRCNFKFYEKYTFDESIKDVLTSDIYTLAVLNFFKDHYNLYIEIKKEHFYVQVYKVLLGNRVMLELLYEKEADAITQLIKQSHDIGASLVKVEKELKKYSFSNILDLYTVLDVHAEDLEKIKNKVEGAIDLHSSGLFENCIPDFETFLKEEELTSSELSKNRDASIYYLNGLTRSYKTATSSMHSTDFENLGEKVRMMEFRNHLDSFDPQIKDCEREISFKLNDEEVFMKFDFDVIYSGQEANDNHDVMIDSYKHMYCVLDDIVINKFEIVSPRVTKIYTKFRPDLTRAIKECLIKLSEPWYDILGKELDKYDFEQK